MTNNDEPALKLEQIEWLHGAAEEAAAVNLKMTMKPEEILQITSMLLALLAERDADKNRIAELEESLEKAQSQSSKWLEAYHKAVSVGARYEERIAEQQEHISSLNEGVDMLLAQYDQLASAIGWTTEKALTGEGNQEQYAEAMVKRIAELEARTMSVKLPKTIWYEHDDLARDVAVLEKRLVRKALREACAAAGIKLEVGE